MLPVSLTCEAWAEHWDLQPCAATVHGQALHIRTHYIGGKTLTLALFLFPGHSLLPTEQWDLAQSTDVAMAATSTAARAESEAAAPHCPCCPRPLTRPAGHLCTQQAERAAGAVLAALETKAGALAKREKQCENNRGQGLLQREEKSDQPLSPGEENKTKELL